MQTSALIQTKLHPPTLRPNLLPRNQLVERLNNGRFRKLTLISAPAGYGKTVLASVWHNACKCPIAWLSLDKKDNELGVFLSYAIEALQTILPNAYNDTKALLNGLQLPPLDELLISLVNETVVLSQPFILVLDDYHLIHNLDIHQLIDSIIQYQSSNMQLVLITRQDPPFDLNNLRAQNQITEIRLAELRFNETEAQKYLQINLDNNLTPDLALQLYKHTEGWAVGLRMTVLALRNKVDRDKYLKTFQGQNQYVMSYLMAEVLAHQPHAVQLFLLKTSLLDRFCAPLCDALLSVENPEHKPGSEEMLNDLCRDNLFLIALDHQGKWFRYHHLFQDLLRHQLETTVTEPEINQLHLQVSSWFAQQGFLEEALDYAFSADDTDYAIQIMTGARYRLLNETQWQRLQKLLHCFPHDVINHSPDLLMAEAWLAYHHSQYTKLPAILTRVNQLINDTVVSPENKKRLSGEISTLHSMLSYFAVDAENTIIHAKYTLKHTAPDFWILRVFTRQLLALGQQMAGDLNSAYSTILSNFDEEPMQNDLFKATTLVTFSVIGWIAADLKSVQQNASEALKLCENTLSPEMRGYAYYHLGTVDYLQNDLSAAEERFSYVYQRPYNSYGDCFMYASCGLAQTYQAQGREDDANDVVDTALAFLLVTGNTHLYTLMKAFQADLATQQGQLSIALQWLAQYDSIPPLSPMYRLHGLHFALVKIWLAENTADSRQKACDLLLQLKTFLQSTHNNIFLIQALAMQAVCCQLDGDETKALATLKQALTLALPGQIIRLFVDLGPVMVNLLSKLTVKDPELAAYRSQILAAIAPTGESVKQTENPLPLRGSLTDRELEVLNLLSQRYTDREIAQELIVSLNTVHTHTKNIYNKLKVNNRRQAAQRAIDLNLVIDE